MALINVDTNLNTGTGVDIDEFFGNDPDGNPIPSAYVRELDVSLTNGGLVLSPGVTLEAENYMFDVSHILTDSGSATTFGTGTLNLTNCQVHAWVFRNITPAGAGTSILTLQNGDWNNVAYFGTGGRVNLTLGDNVDLNNVIIQVAQTDIPDPVPAALFAADARRFPQISTDFRLFDFENSDFNNVTLGNGTATLLPGNAKLGGTIFGRWGALTDTSRPASHVVDVRNGGVILGHPDFSNTFPNFNFTGSWQGVLGGAQILGANDIVMVNPLFNLNGGAYTRTVGGVSIDQGRMAVIKFNNVQAGVIVCNALSARFFDNAAFAAGTSVDDSTARDIKFDLDVSATSPVDAISLRGNLGWGNDINGLTYTTTATDLTAANLAQGMLIRSRTSSLPGAGVAGTTAGATAPTPTTANAGNLVSGQHHNIPYRVWSYSHNIPFTGMLDTQNVVSDNGGTYAIPGSLLSNANPDFFEGQTANEAVDSYGATVDRNLNGVAFADSQAAVTSANNIYPNVKRARWENKFAENMEPTIVNGVFTTTKTLELGTTNSYAAGAIGINTGAVITATDEVTGIASSSTNIDGTGFSGITINGATTGNIGALTNNTSITTTNAAAQTVVSIDNSSLISTGALTITGAASESTIQSTGGTLRVMGVSTDNDIDAGGTVRIDGYTTRGTINNTAGQIDLFGGGEDTVTVSTGHTDIEPVVGEEYTRINSTATTGNSDVRAQNTTLIDCVFTASRDVLLTGANVSGGTYTAADDIQAEDSTITGGTFTAVDEVDLDNATISGGEFETVDDIILTNATVTGGVFRSTGNTLAANGINITDATISNATLDCRRLYLVEPGELVDNNIFGSAGREFQIGFNITAAYTGDLAGLLGTNYTVEADSTTFTNTFAGVVTIEVSLFDVQQFQIMNTAGTALLGQGESVTLNNITFTFVAPGTTTTFTNQPSADGGNIAVFNRATPTANWALITNGAQTVAANAVSTVTAVDALGEYLILWKPLNSITYTTVNYQNFAVIAPVDNEVETLTTTIVELLRSANDDIPAGVAYSIVWSNVTLGGVNQYLGTIDGTNDARLSGAATQTLLRDGLSEQLYFDFLRANSDDILSTDAATIQAAGYSIDFLQSADPNSSRVNGDFLELDTSDGTQQRLTAVENISLTGTTPISGKISAEISRTDATATPMTVTFDAVDIATNPEGISAAEVREAVRTLTDALSSEHGRLSQNQESNQVATQRGAVKAATYSAPDIDIIT